MTITLQNIPYFSLMWTGIGFFLTIIGVFALAHYQSKQEEYTAYEKTKEKSHVEDLFSYFLQEEANKQEEMNEIKKEESPKITDATKNDIKEEGQYETIVQLYEEGLSPEVIAKQLKLGIGEVKLILSLYSMR